MSNIQIKEIEDQEIWDTFLKSSPYNYFLQTWQWGEFSMKIVKGVCRIGGYIDDKLIGIASLTQEHSRFGDIIYCPRGPVTDWENIEQVKSLLEGIKNHIKAKYNPVSLKFEPKILLENEGITNVFKSLGFKDAVTFWQVERSWMLDLEGKTDEELLTNMRKNTRYGIRKAIKAGVEVIRSTDISEIEKFVDMLHSLSDKKKFSPLPKRYILEQFKTFGIENDFFRYYKAMYQGKVLASAIISFYNEEGSYLHGASSGLGDIQAPYLLQWSAIQAARDAGLKRYNFWGIVDEKKYKQNHPGFGYSNFKKGFGGYVEEYIRGQDFVFKPIQYNLIRLQEIYRRWRFKGV